ELPVPGDQGAAEPGVDDAVPGGEAAPDRNVRVPAVPPGDRDRGYQRGVRVEDRETGVGEVPGRVTRGRFGCGARLPGSRTGSRGAGADPPVRDRGAVRRAVLLPRRTGRAAAPER